MLCFHLHIQGFILIEIYVYVFILNNHVGGLISIFNLKQQKPRSTK